MPAVKLRTASTAPPSGAFSISWMMRLPITTASATLATALAVAPSRMPKPTPIGNFTCWRMAARRSCHLFRINVTRARNTLERHIIAEAAANLGHLRDALFGRSGCQQEDQVEAGFTHGGPKLLALFRRIVDDDGAIGAGRVALPQ